MIVTMRRLLGLLVVAGGCGDDGGGISIHQAAECGAAFPAFACDGDPVGEWQLVSYCIETYKDCDGARVSGGGTATGTLVLDAAGSVMHSYDRELELSKSVPLECLDGASCESIGCFDGDDPCACEVGESSGGFQSATYTPGGSRVTLDFPDSPMDFCAGATRADSVTAAGERMIWERAD